MTTRASTPSETPMMRQYLDVKKRYPDGLLFYRLGDFYEMFFDDAVKASKTLGLTLTTRNKNSAESVPMCGIPYHASQNYISRLLEQGQKVVICDQLEVAGKQKLVARDVTRVLTKATTVDDENLSPQTDSLLFSTVFAQNQYYLVITSVTAGTIEMVTLNSIEELNEELEKFTPCEWLATAELTQTPKLMLPEKILTQIQSPMAFTQAKDLLLQYYDVSDLAVLDMDHDSPFVLTLGYLWRTLEQNKILAKGLFHLPKKRSQKGVMNLSANTLLHLDVLKSDDKESISLFSWLNACETAMGSRELAVWLRTPLCDLLAISARQNAVSYFVEQHNFTTELRQKLANLADLGRLSARLATSKAWPRDLLALAQSLFVFEELWQSLKTVSVLNLPIFTLTDVLELAQTTIKTLVEVPANVIHEGNLIRQGVNDALDELQSLTHDATGYLLKLEEAEREATKISSLKIRYNSVFGYYIEVTHTHKEKVPSHYQRKQTLTNAERYTTEELKTLEARILSARERARSLEQEIFIELRTRWVSFAELVRSIGEFLAQLDVYTALATVAKREQLSCPTLVADPKLELNQAWHPLLPVRVSEQVKNDVLMEKDQPFLMITGPNMSGKSTLMRLCAINVLLAHVGAFVPAKSAVMGLCDQIFTRVGARDLQNRGFSTFMVEMVETAQILKSVTRNSLVLMDEVGRGTSTYDGLSIATALAECLAQVGARTLFATHYHELCKLADNHTTIKNVHLAVAEKNDRIVFLRLLKSGATAKSFGLHVAKMAGLPPSLITRAQVVLQHLEAIPATSIHGPLFKTYVSPEPTSPLQPSELENKLNTVDLSNLTPREALNLLFELKESLS